MSSEIRAGTSCSAACPVLAALAGWELSAPQSAPQLCPFALTLPLESGLAGGMLSLRLEQYGTVEKHSHHPSFPKPPTFFLWPPGCLDTTLSCQGIIAIES